jgi:hypothetical protein
MKAMKNSCNILVGNLKGRDHLGDLDLYGKIILKCLFKISDARMCIRFIWLKIRPSVRIL